MKIRIKKSPNADTRSAKSEISKSELLKASKMHINDVRQAIDLMLVRLAFIGNRHDWTKIEYIDEFYKQFNNAQKTGEWGKGWYDEIHIKKERHHLKDNPPEDVDLFDVLEQIADGVMAGLARSGEYRKEELPNGLLEKAYNNTIKKLLNMVEVED